jgi:hypothetical protein
MPPIKLRGVKIIGATENPRVGGSIPSTGTNNFLPKGESVTYVSGIECYLSISKDIQPLDSYRTTEDRSCTT